MFEENFMAILNETQHKQIIIRRNNRTVQQWETEAIKVLIILWAAEKVQGSLNLIASYVLKLPPVITPLEHPVCALCSTKHNIDWIL